MLHTEPFAEAHLERCTDLLVLGAHGIPWELRWKRRRAMRRRLLELSLCPGFMGMVVLEEDRLLAFVMGRIQPGFFGHEFLIAEVGHTPKESGTSVMVQLIEAFGDLCEEQSIVRVKSVAEVGSEWENVLREGGFEVVEGLRMWQRRHTIKQSESQSEK